MKTGFYFTADERGWLDKKQKETVSLSPLNALKNATGNYCWVLLYPEKTFLAGFNAELILRRFAKDCALDVIHLWNAPEIVRKYLKSDSEELRNVAWDTARDAVRDATWNAAWNVAWDAVRDAARNAARSAARSAVRNAARDAAWNAALGAAWGAAKDAAWKKYDQKLEAILQQKVTNEEKADCKS